MTIILLVMAAGSWGFAKLADMRGDRLVKQGSREPFIYLADREANRWRLFAILLVCLASLF